MSIYLVGTSVLLDGSGNVAIDGMCCCLPSCSPCGAFAFRAFDGSGRRFFTLYKYSQTTINGADCCPYDGPSSSNCFGSTLETTNRVTCFVSADAEGGGTITNCMDVTTDCATVGADDPPAGWDTVTATQRTTIITGFACGSPNRGTTTFFYQQTLSDECTP